MIAQALAKTFSPDRAALVVTPSHKDYEKLRRVWDGVANRYPAGIVRAAGLADVQRSVRVAAENNSLNRRGHDQVDLRSRLSRRP